MRHAPCGACRIRLSIKYISSIYAARASQSSAVPQTAEEGQIVFSGGVYVGKHTSQAASVRAKASARSGLHPLEKMPAFLRSVSKFFDTLNPRRSIRNGGGSDCR